MSRLSNLQTLEVASNDYVYNLIIHPVIEAFHAKAFPALKRFCDNSDCRSVHSFENKINRQFVSTLATRPGLTELVVSVGLVDWQSHALVELIEGGHFKALQKLHLRNLDLQEFSLRALAQAIEAGGLPNVEDFSMGSSFRCVDCHYRAFHRKDDGPTKEEDCDAVAALTCALGHSNFPLRKMQVGETLNWPLLLQRAQTGGFRRLEEIDATGLFHYPVKKGDKPLALAKSLPALKRLLLSCAGCQLDWCEFLLRESDNADVVKVVDFEDVMASPYVGRNAIAARVAKFPYSVFH
jgi:hypothetical protein